MSIEERCSFEPALTRGCADSGNMQNESKSSAGSQLPVGLPGRYVSTLYIQVTRLMQT